MKESREIIKQTVEKTELERPFEPQIVPNGGRYPAYREIYAQDGFQLLDYWRAIRKRLWLVIGIAVLVTTLTAIYMARKPNVYMATGTVQVDLEQINQDLVTNDRRLPAPPDPSYFNTQLQLLNSESLLRRVVKEYSLDSNKEFQAAKNEGSVSPLRSMLKAIGLASESPKKDEKSAGDTTSTANMNLASSEEIAEAVRLAPYVEIIKKNLGIDPVREARATFKDTRLIVVSYRHTNPELASFIVNGIIETFSKANQEKRSGTQRKTNDFLSDRIAELQGQIKTDETKLVALKRDVGIINTEGEQTVVTQRLTGLNKDLLEAENARKNAEAQYKAVANSPERQRALAEEEMARYFTERENDIRSVINETQKKIADLKAQKSKLLEEYQPTAFEVQEVETQIKSLENSINNITQKNTEDLEAFRKRTTNSKIEYLKTKYIQAQQKEDKIRVAFNDQYSTAEGQSQGAVNIKLLEQNIATNRGFLENLQKQVSENDVISKGSENNINVAEISIPPDVPVSPRRLTTVMAALFLSTLFGMGLALFLEYLDDTIRSTEEIENYLQLPALAAIPTIDSMPKRRLLLVGNTPNEEGENKAKSELLIHSDSRSALAEAYRQLRTSILLSTAGHAPKSLLITSSLPSEGKTTTATNTAISLAQTGAKVLIIDADMRRPRLHNVFDISNAEGLSTILSSEMTEKEMVDVVQYDEASKLHLLPSGPVPPNPAELIGSEQMSNFLKKMSANFTHVVVDSPPIASFTDGVLIASMVDGVILVVHAGKSSRQVIRRSKQLLNEIGAKIFGVVLNNVNLRSQDNYYYYQSYYHSNNYRHDDE